ncbi:hypothetical protein HK096_010292, partial [Nowakowskiella sp. JEL0078]
MPNNDGDESYVNDVPITYWCYQCEVWFSFHLVFAHQVHSTHLYLILTFYFKISSLQQAEIDAIQDSGIPTCPRCGSEFVEEIDGGDRNRNSNGEDGLNFLGEFASTRHGPEVMHALQRFFQRLPISAASINIQQVGNNGEAVQLNIGGMSDQLGGVSDGDVIAEANGVHGSEAIAEQPQQNL